MNDELPIEWCLSKSGINIIKEVNESSNDKYLEPQELKDMYEKYAKTAWHLKTAPGIVF